MCKICYDCFVDHNKTLQILIAAGMSATVWWDYKCVHMVCTDCFVAVDKWQDSIKLWRCVFLLLLVRFICAFLLKHTKCRIWDKIMVYGELEEAAGLVAQLWFQTNQNKNEICYCSIHYYYKYLQWSGPSHISASHDILHVFLAFSFFINPVIS